MSGGRTTKQLERAVAARSPEPCQGMRRTVAWSQLASRYAGRKRVRSVAGSGSARAACAKWGARLGSPARARSMGAAKSRKVTMVETGLPGRPKKGSGAAFSRGRSPKTVGLPGWMRTPVKWKMAPRSASACSTRSYLPAETPPESTARSEDCCALFTSARRSFRLSRAMPRRCGSPPASAICVARL